MGIRITNSNLSKMSKTNNYLRGEVRLSIGKSKGLQGGENEKRRKQKEMGAARKDSEDALEELD